MIKTFSFDMFINDQSTQSAIVLNTLTNFDIFKSIDCYFHIQINEETIFT